MKDLKKAACLTLTDIRLEIVEIMSNNERTQELENRLQDLQVYEIYKVKRGEL